MPTSLHIAFVLNRLAGGGAETQVRRLAPALTHRGHSVTIISLQPDVLTPSEFGDEQIMLLNLKGSSGFRALATAPRLVRTLRSIQPDVIVSMMLPADPLARIAARRTGLPLVSSIRNQYVGGRLPNALLCMTDAFASRVTANAETTRRHLGPSIAKKPQDIQILPNIIDPRRYQASPEEAEQARADLDLPTHSFLWLAVGAQRPQKNYLELLRAFATLPETASLAIAGAPYQEQLLQNEAQTLGVQERVRLLGRRSDIAALLGACDGFVQASVHEGTPNAVLEAMAAARPVVATSAGDTPRLIAHDQTGWLVPVGDGPALAQMMHHVMQLDPQERAKVANGGLHYIETHHAPESVTTNWESLFFETVDAFHNTERRAGS